LTESLAKEASAIQREIKTCTTYEVVQALTFLYTVTFAIEKFFPRIMKYFLERDLRTILNMIICNDEIKTTKLIKFYYCAICSVGYKSKDIPEKPYSPMGGSKLLPFPSVAYKALYRRVAKGGRRAVTFCSSIFLARYAAVKVPDSFIKSSSDVYKTRLTKEALDKDYNINSIKSSLIQLKKKNRVDEFVKYSNNLSKCLSVSSVSNERQVGLINHGQIGIIEKMAPKVSFKRENFEYDGMCPAPYFAYSFVDEQMTGTATHLCEPLKIRSITTASAEEFFAGKPFQATISEKMKDMENLVYGRSVEESDICNLIGRCEQYYPGEKLLFLSGDYAAATDNLNPKLSKIVDEMMIERLNLNFLIPEHKEDALMLWNLMAKIFHYSMQGESYGPNESKRNWTNINLFFKINVEKHFGVETVLDKRNNLWSGRIITDRLQSEKFTQTMGQMMGDIKSFPVLCMINLSLWNLVNDNKNKKIMKKSTCPLTGLISHKSERIRPPCLINGDDFLTFAPQRVIDKWFSLVSEFDLEASIGKTYVSEKVAQINSTNFYLSPKGVTKVKAIPIHAVMSLPSDKPINQNINYAIEHDKSLLNRVIFNNLKRIKEVTANGLINLCLPIPLGGIGVDCEPKSITRRQYAIAHYNRRSYNPLELMYNWVPHISKNRQQYIYKQVPKGTGLTKDKYGFEHILPTYKSKSSFRGIQRDDWIANMSRMRYNGKNGRMIIKGNFFKKFASLSNKLKDDKSIIERIFQIPKLELFAHRYRKRPFESMDLIVRQAVQPTFLLTYENMVL
jgi:hypothetical protein